MKKSVCLILSVLFILLAFTSCASQGKHDKTAYLEDSSLSLTTPKAEVIEKLGLVSSELLESLYSYPEGKYVSINNVSMEASFVFDYHEDGFLSLVTYFPVDENLPADSKDKMKKYLDSIYGSESQEYADEYDETGLYWTTEVDGKTFQIVLVNSCDPLKVRVEYMDDDSGNTNSSIFSTNESESKSEIESEKTESKTEPVSNDIPSSVKNIYNKIVSISSNYPDLKIGNLEINSFDDPAFTVEDTSDTSKTKSQRTLNVSFGSSTHNPEDSSCSVLFDIKKQQTVLKKWIALWMEACDETLTHNDAQSKMQDFANTYSSDAFSDVMECGDYLLLLSPGNNGSFGQIFTATYKPCLWESIDESEYTQADFATYQASDMNSGMQVILKGTVKDFVTDEPKDIAPFARLTVEDVDGNQYEAVYSYMYAPISFDPDTEVTVYGTIGTSNDDPVIFVDKIVE